MTATRSDQAAFTFTLFPAVIPAVCYLLLETLPIAYAAAGIVFLVTPIVCGTLLGWKHPGLPAARYFAAGITYALASVLVAELADALIPLLASNLVNLPVYTIVASVLFSGAALLARAIRGAQRERRAMV